MLSHTTSLSLAQLDAHVLAAQAIILDMSNVATGQLNELITAHGNAIGSPSKFISPPTAFHCRPLHRNFKSSYDKQGLWTVVLADKGQKKLPALNRFIKPIQQMEVDLNDTVEAVNSNSEENPPQIYTEHFSIEELHYTLKRKDGRVVGLYDEILLLYEQLDKYKSKTSVKTAHLR